MEPMFDSEEDELVLEQVSSLFEVHVYVILIFLRGLHYVWRMNFVLQFSFFFFRMRAPLKAN